LVALANSAGFIALDNSPPLLDVVSPAKCSCENPTEEIMKSPIMIIFFIPIYFFDYNKDIFFWYLKNS
jgi:hypothetical protein